MNNHYANSCGCGKPGVPPVSMPHRSEKSLAMAYVPWQKWQNVMDGCSGLKSGTIFEELVLPFEGVRAACSSFACKERNYNNNYYRRGIK